MNEHYFNEFLARLESCRELNYPKSILYSFCVLIQKKIQPSYPRNLWLSRIQPYFSGKEKYLKIIEKNSRVDAVLYYFLLSFNFYEFPPPDKYSFIYNHEVLFSIISAIDDNFERYASEAIWSMNLQQKAGARNLERKLKKTDT